MGIVDRNIEDLKRLCTMYNVEKMYLFGSALNSNFNKESDVDLLVKFKVIELGNLSGGIYLFSVGDNLKQTFKVIKE